MLQGGFRVRLRPGMAEAERPGMGLQRHLKVLGIFARIRYRDGKPAYLEDAPRFLGYITSAPAPIGMLGDLLAAAVKAVSAVRMVRAEG